MDELATGLKAKLQLIMDDVLTAVADGSRLIVLSELDIDPYTGPAPLNVVVGSINQVRSPRVHMHTGLVEPACH